MPYVSVSPLSHNFMEWHGNLKGPEGTPYEGGVFHFTIEFKPDHPRSVVTNVCITETTMTSSTLVCYITTCRSPPKVTMKTRIEHPCVLNGWVRLEFLDVKTEKKSRTIQPAANGERYKMWSPAYTVMSILIQLQGLS